MIQMTIVGRLGKDATVKQFNGKSVIDFSVAVDTGYGDRKKTLWIECSKWGDNTKVSEYLLKGKQVVVHGEAGLRTWENETKHGAALTLRVSELSLVGDRVQSSNQAQTGGDSQATQSAGAGNAADITEPVDDLPF